MLKVFWRQRFYGFHSRYAIYILVIIVTYFTIRFASNFHSDSNKIIERDRQYAVDELSGFNEDIDNVHCHVPKVLLEATNNFQGYKEKILCANGTLAMFKMSYGSNLVWLNRNDSFRTTMSCCYHSFWRLKLQPDFHLQSTPACYPITEEVTRIPDSHEFIHIICTDQNSGKVIYQDQLGHYTLNPNIENLRSELYVPEDRPSLSIVMLGLGSISRWNFRKFMPKSHRYLLRNLDAIEFTGFHSLDSGKYGNLLPMLSGNALSNFFGSCLGNDESYFDSCPFTWYKLSFLGYRTSYQDDDQTFSDYTWGGRTLKKFLVQPFDYDLRTLTVNNSFQVNEKNGKGSDLTDEPYCFGPRLRFQILLDNLLLLADSLKSKLHFHLTWSSSLTGNERARLGDEPLWKALRELKGRNLLNDTILILFSDQGSSSGMQLEEQLPLLYIVLPSWFPPQFPTAMRNLKNNKGRLTTVLDVYETYYAVTNLSSLHDELKKESVRTHTSTGGLNLFLPISPNRTCGQAWIEFAECFTCAQTSEKIPTDPSLLRTVAVKAIDVVNKKITRSRKCVQLKLNPEIPVFGSVVTYRKETISDYGTWEGFSAVRQHKTLILKLTTQPWNISWVATVRREKDGNFTVQSIQRFNLNDHPIQCRSVDPEIREFCICNEN